MYKEVILKSGVKIINFNIPQKIYFDDGSILEAVKLEQLNKLRLLSVDIEIESSHGNFIEVDRQFKLTKECQEAITEVQNYARKNNINIILVSKALLDVTKKEGSPFRLFTLCKESKTQISLSNKFCR